MSLEDIKIVHRDEFIPCWYQLSFKNEDLYFKIHKDIAPEVEKVSPEAPIIKHYQQSSYFGEFSKNLTTEIGFDSSLVYMNDRNPDFFVYQVQIPPGLEETCDWCKGTGKDHMNAREKCRACEGKKKKKKFDKRKALAVTATFNILSVLLNTPQSPTSSTLPQLITFHCNAISPGISGAFSPTTGRWLTKGGVRKLEKMEDAMKIVYGKMAHMSDYELFKFSANVDYESGWLNVSCPGNACGINPAYPSVEANRGYEFADHNVDTHIQLLSLIAGLGALHDLVVADLSKL